MIGSKGDTKPINEFVLKGDDESKGSLNKREFK